VPRWVTNGCKDSVLKRRPDADPSEQKIEKTRSFLASPDDGGAKRTAQENLAGATEMAQRVQWGNGPRVGRGNPLVDFRMPKPEGRP